MGDIFQINKVKRIQFHIENFIVFDSYFWNASQTYEWCLYVDLVK